MKGFSVYSKKDVKKPLTLKEATDIRIVKRGLGFLYLFDVTGILYAFYRRLYTLGIFLIFVMVVLAVLPSFQMFANHMQYIDFIRIAIGVTLAIFSIEIEEYFLTKRGYKMQGFILAQNAKEASLKIEEQIKLSNKKDIGIFARKFGRKK